MPIRHSEIEDAGYESKAVAVTEGWTRVAFEAETNLAVGWVEPQHFREDGLRHLHIAESPRAEPGAVQAPEQRPVVDEAPRQHTV